MKFARFQNCVFPSVFTALLILRFHHQQSKRKEWSVVDLLSSRDEILYTCCSLSEYLQCCQTGFTGPLFSFDVHEDIRLINDASVERDEVLCVCVLLDGWVGGCGCVCVLLDGWVGGCVCAGITTER